MSLFKILGFAPNDIQIYELALVHKSSPLKLEENKWANNERLEYLGDAILDAVVADILYKQYPTKREGFLTNTRSKIVQRETLDQLAIKSILPNYAAIPIIFTVMRSKPSLARSIWIKGMTKPINSFVTD